VLELIIKTIALFFLTQAAFMFLTSAVSERAASFVPQFARARFFAVTHVVSFAVAIAFSAMMAMLAQTGAVTMVTPYFHTLMHGPVEQGIIVSGWTGLILSILVSYLFTRSGAMPKLPKRAIAKSYNRIPVIETNAVVVAALIGAIRPVILVSNDIAADSQAREITLLHEFTHHKLSHNAMKLFFRALLRLNMFNLPLYRIVRGLALECEYECDSVAARQIGRVEYQAYLRSLTRNLGKEVKASAPDDFLRRIESTLDTRIQKLDGGAEPHPHRSFSRSSFAAYAFSLVPPALLIAALSLLAAPRCAIVCFLGF
jgi:hypothetical protein